jgi:hypothetical protein
MALLFAGLVLLLPLNSGQTCRMARYQLVGPASSSRQPVNPGIFIRTFRRCIQSLFSLFRHSRGLLGIAGTGLESWSHAAWHGEKHCVCLSRYTHMSEYSPFTNASTDHPRPL